MSAITEKYGSEDLCIARGSTPNAPGTPIAKRTRSARRRNQHAEPFLQLMPNARKIQKQKRNVRKEVTLTSVLEVKLQRVVIEPTVGSRDDQKKSEHEESKETLERVIPQLEIVRRPITYKLYLSGELYVFSPGLATIRTFKPVIIIKASSLDRKVKIDESTLIGYIVPNGSHSNHISFALHVTNIMHRKSNQIKFKKEDDAATAGPKLNLGFDYNNTKFKVISKLNELLSNSLVKDKILKKQQDPQNFKQGIIGSELVIRRIVGKKPQGGVKKCRNGSELTNQEIPQKVPSQQSAKNGLENLIFEPYVPDKFRKLKPSVPKAIILKDDSKNPLKPFNVPPPKSLPNTLKSEPKTKQTKSTLKVRSTVSRKNANCEKTSGNRMPNVQITTMQRNVGQQIFQPEIAQNHSAIPTITNNWLVSYNNFLQINYFPNYIFYRITPFPARDNVRPLREEEVVELKNDISRTYNLVGDVVSLNELFLLDNNQFLSSNVRMSDIFP
ncbi:unnamed protein product [Hermetia illucens]|uniref:Uncharacterized protein n=1 Tax=Hermetia illucens TaxID=343691 RepID=A0A7R8UHB1_HERIL|nr:unnamed protein product [Hermetia illucens]